MVRLTLPEGRQVREERGRPRALAAERVGADGSGSQSSRRSCGAPGTSGQCQERGLDSAGGRSIHPPPTPPGLWLLSPREWSPSLQFFWRVILGRIMGGRHGKSKQHSLDCGKGSGTIAPLTLKREKDIPHLSFSSVKWKLRKTHSLLCLSPSS